MEDAQTVKEVVEGCECILQNFMREDSSVVLKIIFRCARVQAPLRQCQSPIIQLMVPNR
jgi:hypothetical protein